MSVIDRFKNEKEEVRLKPGDQDTDVNVREDENPEDVTHFFNEEREQEEKRTSADLPGANTAETRNRSPKNTAEQLTDRLDTIIDQNQRIITLLEQYTDTPPSEQSTSETETSTSNSNTGNTETLW